MKIVTVAMLAGLLVAGWYAFSRDQDSGLSHSESEEPMRMSIITDIDHCPSRAAVNEAWLDRFLKDAEERRADLIVSLGDNASHGLRECSATGDADARYIAERLRSSGLPVHMVLGDHDIEGEVASYEAWLATTGQPRTYYAFTEKDVRVIILDTVLGGDPMSPPCEALEECRTLAERRELVDQLSFAEYRERYPESTPDVTTEKKELRKAHEVLEEAIKNTRSTGRHDKGRIGEEQLHWLAAELAQARENKVLVLSDHPLFDFTSHRKRYNIVNGDRVRSLLQASGKEVVAISGEAHLWHAEKREGIPYYIVDAFKDHTGPTAFFSWPQEGHRFEQVVYEPLPEEEK